MYNDATAILPLPNEQSRKKKSPEPLLLTHEILLFLLYLSKSNKTQPVNM